MVAVCLVKQDQSHDVGPSRDNCARHHIGPVTQLARGLENVGPFFGRNARTGGESA